MFYSKWLFGHVEGRFGGHGENIPPESWKILLNVREWSKRAFSEKKHFSSNCSFIHSALKNATLERTPKNIYRKPKNFPSMSENGEKLWLFQKWDFFQTFHRIRRMQLWQACQKTLRNSRQLFVQGSSMVAKRFCNKTFFLKVFYPASKWRLRKFRRKCSP